RWWSRARRTWQYLRWLRVGWDQCRENCLPPSINQGRKRFVLFTRTRPRLPAFSAGSREKSYGNLAEEDFGFLVPLDRDSLELVGGFGQVNADDFGAAQGDHLAEVLVVDRGDGVQAQPGGQHPVEGGRRTAALHVAQDHRAGFLAGARLDLFGEALADAAEADVAEGVAFRAGQGELALLRVGALGDHDDRRVVGLEAAFDVGDDLVDVEWALGDQDDVGAGRHARVQRNPARVAAHDLDDQGTVVRLGGGVQAVDGLGRDVDRSVEAEGVVGGVEVVVDGLGHTDHVDTVVVELARDAEGVLTADCDERVHPERGHVVLDPLDAALDLHEVGARGAEDGTAAREDAADRLDVQRHGVAFQGAAPPVTESDELVSVFLDAL